MAEQTIQADPPLLSPTDIEQLGGNLFIIARTLVEGLYHGRHATPDRGGSTEFFDYRMYVAGDDLRHVDWKLLGRSDRIYVRRYRHFSDLSVQLVVDASASMDFASLDGSETSGTVPTKWRYACVLASAIAFLTVRQSDRVGLVLASDQVGLREMSMPFGSSWSHLQRVIHALEDAKPGGQVTLEESLGVVPHTAPLRRRIILISDFLDDMTGLMKVVQKLHCEGCDITALQILSPDELDPSGVAGSVTRFIDPETGRSVSTDVRSVATDYVQRLREHVEYVRRSLQAVGASHELVSTDSPLLKVMMGLAGGRTQ